MSKLRYFENSDNPATHNCDLPEPADMQPAAERLAAHRLSSPVAAADLRVDEFTAFEQRASKAFPDLAVEVGMVSKNDRVKGYRGRRYVLRVEGQAVGASRLQVEGQDIAHAIELMIAKVGPARRAVTAAHEAAAVARSRQAA